MRGAAAAGSLATITREWSRIGVTGFGGPPVHIAVLRERDRGARARAVVTVAGSSSLP